jgi:hypothetical protein
MTEQQQAVSTSTALPPDRARSLTSALMARRPGTGGGSNEVVDADLGPT